MQTVSLEVARLIDGLGVKCVSEREWFDGVLGYTGVAARYSASFDVDKLCTPAPNFQELLDILLQIGEKLGWEQEFIDKKFATNFEKVAVYVAHRLLDAYLTGKMPAVDEELIKLLGKK